MISSVLLAFREGLEAALILGIVLGALNQMGRSSSRGAVWLGAALAGGLSLAGGLGLYALDIGFEGAAEQIFEGVAMLLAAGVLTWMVYWMARQGGTVRAELEQDVRQATSGGSDRPLFALAFLAVLREGIELALFLTAASFTTTAAITLIGGVIGLLLAGLAGWLLFASTARLNIHAFFRVTSFLLILFAAGLVAHGVHEFNEVGWIPGIIEHVWDTNSVLDETSGLGEVLKALVGYNGNPSLTEASAYLGYWTFVLLALWRRREQSTRVPAGQRP